MRQSKPEIIQKTSKNQSYGSATKKENQHPERNPDVGQDGIADDKGGDPINRVPILPKDGEN